MPVFETPSGRINVVEIAATPSTADAVLCIHGFCCDARIFSYAANTLSQAGYNVYSMDLPGHGRSEGIRGDLHFDTCLESINQIVLEIKKKSSRVFILAHSMGSTFALWYAHLFRKSIDGLITMSPYIRIGGIKRSDAEPTPLAFLYLLFSRMITPYRTVDIRKVLPGYAKIGATQYARMVQDSEVNFAYSFRYLIDIVAQKNSKLAILSDIDIPVLILYGLKDRNVYPKVSEEFFKLMKTPNKTIKGFDCNHWFFDAIFYSQSSEYDEKDRQEFLSAITDWLKAIVQEKPLSTS
ncbi:MAG TPA: alpha/beta fold hydrolase [Nitrososphaera sp.]|nr:alpha/beta fold hydrolase [Nitrososphaera sp.]